MLGKKVREVHFH